MHTATHWNALQLCADDKILSGCCDCAERAGEREREREKKRYIERERERK